jgi:hypothetical protein
MVYQGHKSVGDAGIVHGIDFVVAELSSDG